VYIGSIGTLSANIKFICMSFRNKKKSNTVFIYCVYPAMSNNPKQLPNCLKTAETSILLVVRCALSCPCLYCYHFLPFESGIRKAIFRSVTIYSKILQSMQYDCSNRTSAVYIDIYVS